MGVGIGHCWYWLQGTTTVYVWLPSTTVIPLLPGGPDANEVVPASWRRPGPTTPPKILIWAAVGIVDAACSQDARQSWSLHVLLLPLRRARYYFGKTKTRCFGKKKSRKQRRLLLLLLRRRRLLLKESAAAELGAVAAARASS